eukprot:m.200280 g.200280  ORF g.200280 m.200280 type:complete len:59 (+) comp13708_c2_seq4:1465-1641(+)
MKSQTCWWMKERTRRKKREDDDDQEDEEEDVDKVRHKTNREKLSQLNLIGTQRTISAQ